MKALITGATGFIGSHLAETLCLRGDQVRCLVRRTSDLRDLQKLPVEFVEGDITDRESLDRAVSGVDVIYHLGGITKARKEATYFKINADGSRLLYEGCSQVNRSIQRIVHVSSLAAAGPSRPGVPKRESDPCTPITFYGKSKWEGEKYAIEYSKQLPITILRPPAVYGPREKDIRIYFQLIHRHLRPILGLRKKFLSLVYSQDLVDAIVLAGDHPKAVGETFYVDDGHVYSWGDLSSVLAEVMRKWTLPLFVPQSLVVGLGYAAEWISQMSDKPAILNRQKILELRQTAWTCSSEKIRRLLGFQSRYDLRAGARLTAAWYEENGWG